MYEDGFTKICSGLQISWLQPYGEVKASSWLLSFAVRSVFHEEEDQTLKSPVTNIKWGFWFILSNISYSKLRRNWLNFSLLWVSDR